MQGGESDDRWRPPSGDGDRRPTRLAMSVRNSTARGCTVPEEGPHSGCGTSLVGRRFDPHIPRSWISLTTRRVVALTVVSHLTRKCPRMCGLTLLTRPSLTERSRSAQRRSEELYTRSSCGSKILAGGAASNSAVLRADMTETLKWKARPTVNASWVAVVVPEGDDSRRRERFAAMKRWPSLESLRCDSPWRRLDRPPRESLRMEGAALTAKVAVFAGWAHVQPTGQRRLPARPRSFPTRKRESSPPPRATLAVHRDTRW